jgi:5'-3' exonuclease
VTVTTRLALDTSSLVYRAFFALPSSITGQDGRPINALHGYLDMTATLVRERGPDEVLHALDDDWRPAPRVEAYAGYKAQRAAEPEDLTPQLEVLPTLLGLLGMSVILAKGWEAEDAIGTLAAGVSAPDRLDIVTGDRDLIQLVRDPLVRLLFTRRGVSDLEVFDEAAVEAKYGVPPSRYADLAVLRGDPSDGLPGVRGVGSKTAVELVRAYPDLEALVADAVAERRTGAPLKRSPALRARVADAAEYLEAMRRVVPIRTDLDLEIRPGKRDDAELDRHAERLKLTGPVRRLREALAG